MFIAAVLALLLLNTIFFDLCAQEEDVCTQKKRIEGSLKHVGLTSFIEKNSTKDRSSDEDDHIAKKVRHDKRELVNRVSSSSDSIYDHIFIYDAYTHRRGVPVMLKIQCKNCDVFVMNYQKDGPGKLLRCYLDRIHKPKSLSEKQHEPFNPRCAKFLRCVQCNSTIGVPIIYKLENRPAYKMLEGKFYFTII